MDLESTRVTEYDRMINSMQKRKISTGGWKTSPFILVSQCLATLGFQGVAVNLVLYLTKVLHDGNAPAANNVSNWSGTAFFTSVIGAFIGDAYLGRYWTTTMFLAIDFLGLLLLSLSASLPSLRPPPCSAHALNCQHATIGQRATLYIALYIIALGNGGFQPCMSALGADQFDYSDPNEKNQENVFFNWYYVALATGALIAATLLVYIENNISWGLGFGLCAASLGVSLFIFLAGTPFYHQNKPGGNPFVRVAQVLVATARKIKVKVPLNSDLLHEVEGNKATVMAGCRKIMHSHEFSFLDKAATKLDVEETGTGEIISPWYLCTVSQVEEVKCIIRMTPIWVSNIFFSSIYVQMLTLFIVQGATMNTHLGTFKLPPATLSTFGTISVILCTFCYEYALVPCVRRFSGHQRGLTPLQRMGTGFLIMTLAMVAAAIVEKYRLDMARKHGLLDETQKPVPMSVFWQIPQFLLVGAAEVFTYIGQLDFFYEQAPDAMRGLGVAFSYISYALGNYVSTLLVSVVTHLTRKSNGEGWISDNLNRGHLDWFFWLMASLSVINLALYLLSAHWYKGIKLNSTAASS